MAPKKTTLFLLLIVLFIAGGVIIFPRFVSHYYTYLANQALRMAWADPNWIPCESSYPISQAQKDFAVEAISLSENALSYLPSNYHAKLIYSRAACFAGQPERAIKSYQEILQFRSHQPLLWTEYGFALQSIDRTSEAAQAWVNADLVPEDFLLPADQTVNVGNFVESKYWLERALALDPSSGKTWFDLSQILSRTGNGTQVNEALQNAYSYGYTPAIMALVENFITNNELENASDTLQEALKQHTDAPERSSWWVELGKLTTEIGGGQQDVINVYQAAHQEFPENIDILIPYAYALHKDDPANINAIQLLENATINHPDNANLFFSLGDIYANRRNFGKAIDWLEKAVEINPNNAWWRLRLIRTLRNAGDFESSTEAAISSMEHFPKYGYFPYELAVNYNTIGKNSEAVTLLKSALELIADPPVYLLVQAGKIFSDAGDLRTARQLYETVLEKQPQNQQAKELLESLGR